MTQYDPDILRAFADKLYLRANVVTVTSSMIGALIGCAIGFALGEFVQSSFRAHGAHITGLCIGGLLGVALGAVLGQQRAFMLRLEAQRTMCQLQIEANTRQVPDSVAKK